MEVIKKKDIQAMIPVVKEKFPFASDAELYKDLKLASKQFSKDFKFGVL